MKSQRTSTKVEKSRVSAEHSREVLERIRARAYELFVRRGQEHGHDIEDWLKAENEIAQQKVRTTAA